MVKWSRVRLVISILTCEGLLATLRERFQFGPPPQKPAARAPSDPLSPPARHDYAGALHIHSTYSDGVGTVEQIAAAAARAGLDYLVLCDHSNLDTLVHRQDGWHGRTLVLAGTEITTDTGHLLALGVPPGFVPAPDDAVDAQRAIHDAGGVGFIALPCDLKDHWRDFARRLSGVGLEVFNLSAIARTKISLPGLLLVWLRYKSAKRLRAFSLVAARPARELALWDKLMLPAHPDDPSQRVVGIASLDAHAVMRFGGREWPYPTYEESFRTLRTHVLTTAPLSGQPAGAERDGREVHAALAAGRCFMAYDNYADSTGFRFEATLPAEDDLPIGATMGDALPLAPGQSVDLDVHVPQARALVRLFRNGALVAAASGGRLTYTAHQPGAYRVEVYLYRARLGGLCVGAQPWIFSNPIYLQPAPVPAPAPIHAHTSPAPKHAVAPR